MKGSDLPRVRFPPGDSPYSISPSKGRQALFKHGTFQGDKRSAGARNAAHETDRNGCLVVLSAVRVSWPDPGKRIVKPPVSILRRTRFNRFNYQTPFFRFLIRWSHAADRKWADQRTLSSRSVLFPSSSAESPGPHFLQKETSPNAQCCRSRPCSHCDLL